MLENITYLILGFILLVKGSDYLVDAAARMARKLGVSDLVIGLTVIAIGTSLPELAASVIASLKNESGLIIGNIVGSNIANIGLVVGIAACVGSFKVNKRTYERDGFLMIFSTLAFFVFSWDHLITRLEAVSLLGLYALYIMFLIHTKENRTKNYKFHDFLDYFFNFRYVTTVKNAFLKKAIKNRKKEDKQLVKLFWQGLFADCLVVAISIVAIISGAHFLVRESVWLANLWGVPSNLVGLSIVAVGTSLPELMVSISAARKGFGGIVIGNILGSNIANLLLIGGVSSLMVPLTVSSMSVLHMIPIMGFFSLFLLLAIKSNWKLTKNVGIWALSLYVLFLIYAFTLGLT